MHRNGARIRDIARRADGLLVVRLARRLAISAVAICASTACIVGSDFVEEPELYLAAVEKNTFEAVARDVEAVGGEFQRSYASLGVVRIAATKRQLETIEAIEGLVAIEPVLGSTGAGLQFDIEAGSNPSQNLVDTQTTPWGVARVGGPLATPTATLWVLDTGVDEDHADLNIDHENSIDMVEQFTGDDFPDESHGTAVAGVAAAIDNGRDVVGVAPGALVASVRVLDADGRGRSDVFVAGLEHVINNGKKGDVINLSLAARADGEVLKHAVAAAADAGFLITLAAGNAGQDATSFTPAALIHPNVYTVSATDQNDCLAVFSNFGAPVEVAAPGVGILTLSPFEGVTTIDGTSFAAPHVAGLLLAGGTLGADGTVCDDRDDFAETIAYRPR